MVVECALEEIEYYEVDRTVDWIRRGKFERVALQFPDSLLGDSSSVAAHIRLAIEYECRVFVLADTSYGSCCVDEVAAEHVRADCIVHYGPACLSVTRRLPVLYVFGTRKLDVQACGESIVRWFGQDRMLVFYDVQYSRAMPALMERLSHLSEMVWTGLKTGENGCDAFVDTRSEFSGRTYSLPVGRSESEYGILFIGEDGPLLRNLCMFFNRNSVWSCSEGGYIKREGIGVNRELSKRFHLIERAKQVRIIGIIMGTLVVENYLKVLQRLKSTIKRAGKKCYVFVVGKLSVSKLANFTEIDLFVLVACPESSLIDASEYLRPCITPFELEVALGAATWTGEYRCDYQCVISGSASALEEVGSTNIEDNLMRLESDGLSEERGITRRESMPLCSPTSHRTASDVFLERTFRGLIKDLNPGQDACSAVQGLSGIACEYDHERNVDGL